MVWNNINSLHFQYLDFWFVVLLVFGFFYTGTHLKLMYLKEIISFRILIFLTLLFQVPLESINYFPLQVGIFSHIVPHYSFIFSEELRKECLSFYLLFFSRFPVFPSYVMQSLLNAALNRKLYYVQLYRWHRAKEYCNLSLFHSAVFKIKFWVLIKSVLLIFSKFQFTDARACPNVYTYIYINDCFFCGYKQKLKTVLATTKDFKNVTKPPHFIIYKTAETVHQFLPCPASWVFFINSLPTSSGLLMTNPKIKK